MTLRVLPRRPRSFATASSIAYRTPAAVLVALLVSACGSTSTETATGPTPVKCAVNLTAPEGSVAAAGGTHTVVVSTQPECAWSAAADVAWILDLSPAAGQGNGQVQFRVPQNPAGVARQGGVVINGQRAAIRQEAADCTLTVTAPTTDFGPDGGTGSIAVAAPSGCSWTAAASDSWIVLLPPASGTGSGTVNFRITENAGANRAGAVSIGATAAAITQQGAPTPSPGPGPEPRPPTPEPQPCTASLQPAAVSIPAAGGSASFSVSTPSGCEWTANSASSWIAITSAPGGSGAGTVTLGIAANAGGARVGTVEVGAQTFTVSQSAAVAPVCAPGIDPVSRSVGAETATVTVAVTAATGCAWTAASGTAWLTVTGGTAGSGNGTVTLTVAANTGAARSGSASIAGRTFTVSQAAAVTPTPVCAPAIDPVSRSVGADAATVTVAVTAATGCAWTATSGTPWLTITGGAAGSGNGTVTLSIAANTGAARSASATIGGRTFTVSQAAAPAPTPTPTCTPSIDPVSRSVGAETSTVTVAVTAATGCAWTATSGTSWLAIAGGATGSGNGTVTLTIAANPGATRTASASIAGQTFTVTQAGGCTFAINPSAFSAPAGATTGATVGVTAPSSCAWTATANAPWLTITSGTTGSGNGTVTYSVAANTGSQRTGTLTVAGQTFTVTQAAAVAVPCTYSINPTSQTMDGAGGAGTPVSVSTASGCAWSAVANEGWLTITSGASGTGPGTVTFSASAYNGRSRTGTLTIAGRTFTVTQVRCDAMVEPTKQSASAAGGAFTVSVSIPPGCMWSASSDVPWITITAGASGNGDGTVTYLVAPNTGSARTGRITIGDKTLTVDQAKLASPEEASDQVAVPPPAAIPAAWLRHPESAGADLG